MQKGKISVKRLAIDKANSTMIIAVAIAAFITVFSLVASKSLITQMQHQSKVIDKKKIALKQVQSNVKQAETLKISYQDFANQPTNILGGSSASNTGKDGPNARIVLDALPSKYDFPALTTSIDKLVSENGFALKSISGTDDEVNQQAIEPSNMPLTIEMPFELESTMPAANAKQFMELFERSIRPIQIKRLSISGQDTELRVSVIAKTYFQPDYIFKVDEEAVR